MILEEAVERYGLWGRLLASLVRLQHLQTIGSEGLRSCALCPTVEL